ncbi:hypothetical protein F7Q91_03330 [Vibrio chagasii]|uniref:Uncharacterized protein n=1 Tax=Vibrio chagasii TaxID=170679 RepID=A0A7V7NX06_9VIBR|nr:hypothetical protein [Vibrio chagasii]KAB0482454.1 hypothetical protein F7Q91_03330 [Vibrio chagasii]
MELSNYHQIADSLFKSEFSNNDIGYLENRNENLELVIRRGVNVEALLSLFDYGQTATHHINDTTAKKIEAELSVSEGWLDTKHEIKSRKLVVNIRQHNIAQLVIDDKFKVQTKQFLSKIISSTPSMALYYLMYEVNFEEQSFYFRSLENFLDLDICVLDDDML